MTLRQPLAVLLFAALAGTAPVLAHDGPPFPIVSARAAGAYEIAVWTDPDTTDDGTPGGQFWVMLEPLDASGALSAETTVEVAIRANGTEGAWQLARAEPVEGRLDRHFAALVMDHEGRFDVRVEVGGPLGDAAVTAWVDATYDLRPPPVLLGVYLLPFLAVGGLWLKVLLRRHRSRAAGGEARLE
ncbi:MAG TPA: hypothetical protein VF071_10625 [Candidatus Limnocylindria bacterium]